MTATTRTQPHVAIFPFPSSSHPGALLCLARRLAEWAPDVAFSFFGTARTNARFSAWPAMANLNIYNVKVGLPEEGGALPESEDDELELFLSETPSNMREALQMQGLPPVTCVLSDAILWNAGQLAKEMGVPWIAFWIASACSLMAHVSTDLIRSKIGTEPNEVEARLDERLDFVPGFSLFRVGDLPEGIVFGSPDLDSPLPLKFLHRMGQEVPRPGAAAAVLLNTVQEIEQGHSAPLLRHLTSILPKCLPVGPLTLLRPSSDPDPHGCLAWLDAQGPASVAYVGFGTVIVIPRSELAGLAEGLEASGARFLWSLQDNVRETLPAGFLERTRGRGLVVPWVPQVRVLGHVAVGAFANHCGWNSVMEAIAAGVPMLCRPFFAENRINSRLVSEALGIGIRVRGGALTRDGVMDGLDLILRRDEGTRMRKRIASLKLQATGAVADSGTSAMNLKAALDIIKG